MSNAPDHYQTLNLSPSATPAEVKQAYRHLAKLFHPDSNRDVDNHERIAEVNAAYEVLGDPKRRQAYDNQMRYGLGESGEQRGDRTERAAAAQRRYQQQRQREQDTDEQLQRWIKQVYTPVNQCLSKVLNSLKREIDALAADPFDDDLMADFQDYLEDCRQWMEKAQKAFRSMPNPSPVAGVAADLYYCLNQVVDGIEELSLFTLNYDDHYLHTGQEMFRIAVGLRQQARLSLKQVAA